MVFLLSSVSSWSFLDIKGIHSCVLHLMCFSHVNMIFWIIYFSLCLCFLSFLHAALHAQGLVRSGHSKQELAVYPEFTLDIYPHLHLLLVAQISSVWIHAVYQSHYTLCLFHLLRPDPLSSFHHNCNKLLLKSFQHPPGPYAMTHYNDMSTCYESGSGALFYIQTFIWDTLRQAYSTGSVS